MKKAIKKKQKLIVRKASSVSIFLNFFRNIKNNWKFLLFSVVLDFLFIFAFLMLNATQAHYVSTIDSISGSDLVKPSFTLEGEMLSKEDVTKLVNFTEDIKRLIFYYVLFSFLILISFLIYNHFSFMNLKQTNFNFKLFLKHIGLNSILIVFFILVFVFSITILNTMAGAFFLMFFNVFFSYYFLTVNLLFFKTCKIFKSLFLFDLKKIMSFFKFLLLSIIFVIILVVFYIIFFNLSRSVLFSIIFMFLLSIVYYFFRYFYCEWAIKSPEVKTIEDDLLLNKKLMNTKTNRQKVKGDGKRG